MSAGALRDRIRFEKRAEADDGYGNTVSDWTPQFERAAEIRPLKGSEQVIASRLQGTQPALILVRYDSQTATITPEWRAVDARSGTTYNIQTAADMERRREYITMMCTAGGSA
ncbi:phage head closure protein [Microvirga arsenatis]|uniref:Phage head closure protein n=1 Tax=Microvirga arsenatis TaxID=2692265 RepID=A0ABW9YV36_9HYPH|nr:phage head closure protein [Microvirga arsenatis]NBJ13335.1 phage head closure protein [Microvirga arsenatis]NBJ24119.1 phage head closure protein [Microvirga arsenatis]